MKDTKRREKEKYKERERELAVVSCGVCPIVPTAVELFIQSLWYPLKHVATSCKGIERAYVKKSVWEWVCFGCVIKKTVKK